MICYTAAERTAVDARVALTPTTASELRKLGLDLLAPRGVGRASHYADEDYRASGVTFTDDHAASLARADLVLRVRKPAPADIAAMKRGAVHLSFLDPFNEAELIEAFA